MVDSNPVTNITVGPTKTTYGNDYLGETSGDTAFSYSLETTEITTEESGKVGEVVESDPLTVSVPMAETDIDHLAVVLPWANIVEDGNGNKKLTVGSAIGKNLAEYAKELTLHPTAVPDDDHSKDITLHKAYPVPGPLEFTGSRSGQRVANVTFQALKDNTQPEGEEYFVIGDKNVALTPILSTDETITDGDVDPVIVVEVSNDTYADETSVEDTANWTYTDSTSGLTLNTIQKLSDTEVAISFSGTATAETATLEVSAAALDGDSASDPMDIVIQA